MIVKLRPSCTCTGVPSISMTVLPLRYQPSDPVENSLVGTIMGTSQTVMVTGLARLRNCSRVMGQFVFFDIATSLSGKRENRSPPVWPATIPYRRLHFPYVLPD